MFCCNCLDVVVCCLRFLSNLLSSALATISFPLTRLMVIKASSCRPLLISQVGDLGQNSSNIKLMADITSIITNAVFT